MRERIDEISQRISGFFIGRYDIRYTSDADLLRGENFKIIELNGAASEATNIYDERNSLLSAYRTLYQQWDLVYRIGRANRDRGNKPASVLAVLRDAGLVVTERRGQEILYELNTSVFQDVIQHLIEWTRPTIQTGRGRKAHRPRHQEA